MSTYSKEVQSLIAYMAKSGVPSRVTAILGTYISPSDPCDPHSPGSYHCRPGTDGPGLAVDFAEPTPSHDSPGLLRIFASFGPVESKLAELIYYDAPYCIHNGKRVNGFNTFGRTVMGQHRNHVHAAAMLGQLLVPVLPPSDGNVMPDYLVNAVPVALVSSHTGQGYWIVTADGGVFGFGDAPFKGSLGGQILNAPIIGMTPTPSGQGYWLFGKDGGVFTFGDAPYLGRVHQ